MWQIITPASEKTFWQMMAQCGGGLGEIIDMGLGSSVHDLNLILHHLWFLSLGHKSNLTPVTLNTVPVSLKPVSAALRPKRGSERDCC